MRASAQSGSFKLAPAGNHVGYLIRLIDLGTSHNDYYGKDQRKVVLMYELTGELMEPDEDGEQKPYVVSEWVTLSMNEKANLRKRIETWRGKAFSSDEEAEGFDIEALLGQPGLITVIHGKKKNGEERAQIASVIQPPKGMEMPERVNELILFDLANFDQGTFDKISDGIKKYIMDSHEYKALHGETPAKQQNDDAAYAQMNQDAHAGDFDDDIPF